MRVIAWLRSLWGNLVRRDRVEAALDEEVRGYVDLLSAEYERSGMSPADARRRALIESGIALFLAAIGLYGVLAQSVFQRTRELAVRAALGATPRELLGLVLRDGGSLTAIGIAVGIGGSILFIHLLRSMFAGLDAVDVTACGVAVATLVVAALLASYLPARRAARLDVVAALRSD